MLLNYLKIAFRNFRKQKLFSGLNVLGLGIGMAAVWLMVLYVVDELSYDRFHEKSERIYRIAHSAGWDGGSFRVAVTSAPFAPAIRNDYPEVEKTVRINAEGGGLVTAGEKKIEANDIYFTDPSVFDVFTFPFLYGDKKTALNQPQQIVLTRTLAEKLFGDASRALGQTVFFSNHFPNKVSGVIADVPANSHLNFSALRSLPTNYTAGWQQFELYTYLLLKEGTDAGKFEKKLQGFFPKYLKDKLGDIKYSMELQPLTSIHLHSHYDYEIGPNGNINTIYVFSVIAALILIIACINYVNLYTAHSLKRIREVGVRKAVGSRRSQLVGQFLTESLVMTVLAGLAGFVLVVVALPFFNQLAEKSLTIEYRNTAVSACIAASFVMLIGLISGFYPAALFSGYRPVIALKGQTGNQAGNMGFRKSLVVFQFAATVVMIACAGIVYRQMHYVNHKDLGFNKEQVLIFHIDKDEVRTRVKALKEQLMQNPHIAGAAASSNPLGTNSIGSGGMFIEKENGEMPTFTQVIQKYAVDHDYLKTMQIGLVQGRNFYANSRADMTGSVLVNESFVKKQGWKTALGKKVRFFSGNEGQTREARVIGVVHDFHTYSLQHKIEPLALIMPEPADQDNIYVRVNPGNTREALAAIEGIYKTFDPEARLDFHFLDESFARQYRAEERQGNVLLTFAVLAVVIACLGLFGLAAFTAESRTKEIGVRKVLGASVQSVVLLLSKDFIVLVLAAIVIGTPVAVYAMQEWLKNFEYRETLAWWVFASAGLLAIIIALATVSFHALKTALQNPVDSLRSE
ncbi:ABC transporter permease [Dyadobacter sandarakinus]|uniref:ABC transporter permease n=1 Tax=Dyadobacter sandarakinus TaxID=2747268 RepID=A0ABX7I6W3_9BACT|nr:ABC transporter permease [Dyadobacter sandarakinus]QRR01839.1 ABC transporter permease [Dyadobacter sandarakinus]